MTTHSATLTDTTNRRASVEWLRNIRVRIVGNSPTLDVAKRVLGQFGASVVSTPAYTKSGGDADVVIVDRIAGGIGTASEYLADVEARNRSVWVTASAYGLETARANERATDFTLMAAGGILGHSRIGDEWAPTLPPRDLGRKLVGYVLAVSAMHALHTHRTGGQPIHVDVSAQGAVIATGLALEMAHALADCPNEGGSARYGAPSGFFTCADGAIYVLALEEHQWNAFRRALAPIFDTTETLEDARADADSVNARLSSWAADRSMEQCERILQDAGVPCTAVNTVASFVERSHSVGRSVTVSGVHAQAMPAEVTQVPVETPVVVPKTPLALSDLRILDAGHVLAVPLAAAWLGAMGAHVRKLEDPGRLDIYRRRGPFADGKAGLDRSAYFNQLNFNKTSLDVFLDRPESGLDVTQFDVVMHNLTPKRAKTLGVDAESLTSRALSTLTLSSSGFGGRGEWSGYRAYGHNIHAFAGLVAATRDARGGMGDMGTPWADPLTSIAVATWVLAWTLSSERTDSVAVDISMAELTAAQLTDDPIDERPEPDGPSDGSPLEFFARVHDTDQLVAVSLHDRGEQRRFESVAGRALSPALARGELIEVSPPIADDLAAALRAEGIPASKVYTAHDLARDEFMKSTGLFRPVESVALGTYLVTGLPWKFVGAPRHDLVAAPERNID